MDTDDWTSCNEKLPEPLKQVRIHHTALGEKSAHITYGFEGKTWFIEDWGHAPLWRVSHWKPEE